MRLIIAFLIFISSFSSAFELRSGDVLLISLDCKICTLIEAEEGLPYSHTGLALVYPDGKATVLEALGKVKQTSLEEFASRKRAGTKIKIVRPRAMIPTGELIHIYQTRLAGRHYDEDFLWNNADEAGQKFYCSELVVKVLNIFLTEKITTKPMHFNYDREQWLRYFNGNPPDGLPGVSPADLARSPVFDTIGEL